MEAGGHDGKITLMALLENVLPEIEIPVIAAGGIVDGRAVAAALIMGASGVQMGTRFLLSEECRLHPNAKQAIIDGDTENGFVLAGMSLTHLTKVQPVQEIVEELVSEAERRLSAAPKLI